MKNIVFRIRKRYFDEIVAGRKTREARAYSDFWCKRLLKYVNEDDPIRATALALKDDLVAVFICGKRVHRRSIVFVNLVWKVRPFSSQGQQDVPTDRYFDIVLGMERKKED